MDVSTILFIVVIIILLYIIVRYYTTTNGTVLSGLVDATVMQTINSSSLAGTDTGVASNNFSYSIWFYVNDWNYKYGEPKIIFGRMSGSSGDSSAGSVDGVSGNGPCPLVSLDPISNNINVNMSVYPGNVDTNTETSIHKCPVQNIPIQRWVNLLISIYGRTLDVYMDGKLVKTCVMSGVAKINNSAAVFITPNGGFSGWTSNFQYFQNPTDPQTAWNIYKVGYGGSMFSNLFSKYQIKFSMIENGTENASLTI